MCFGRRNVLGFTFHLESCCHCHRRSPHFTVSRQKIHFTAYCCTDCHHDSCWFINYPTR
ncbi:DNA repair protein RecO C-terminal domain-containing protein [Bacillus swezeyi]|uniref:DNA repair protein RecO C-terminal domain-containing protein n=1 Tax=Bacillus swezeyi TaxID=1925020 RepID=UPI00331306B9